MSQPTGFERLPQTAKAVLRDLRPLIGEGQRPDWRAIAAAADLLGRDSGPLAWCFAELASANLALALAAPAIELAPDARVAISWDASDAKWQSKGDEARVSGRWSHVTGAAFADFAILPATGDSGAERWFVVVRDALSVSDPSQPAVLDEAGIRTVFGLDLKPFATLLPGRCDFVSIATAPPQWGALSGCARGAYDEYVAITRKWVGAYGQVKVADLTQVQSRLAACAGRLKMLGLLVHENCDQFDPSGESPVRLEIRRDGAEIARLSLDVASRLVQQMGARGIFQSNPLQQRLADLRAMAGQDRFNWQSNMARFGHAELTDAD